MIPKIQTKVFFTGELIERSSRHSCGMGGLSANARRRELKIEDNDEYPAWRLHPNRVFSNECSECKNPRSQGCLAFESFEGRDVYYFKLYVLRASLVFFIIINFPFVLCRNGHEFL